MSRPLASLTLLAVALFSISAHAQQLGAGQTLQMGQSLPSSDGRYFLLQQYDGNLVLYRAADSKPLWATQKFGTLAAMQYDGNFVQYRVSGSTWTPLWWSGPARPNSSAYNVKVLSSGAMQVYGTSGEAIYTTAADREYGICPSGTAVQSYAVCYSSGSPYQYTSYVAACSSGDAALYARQTGGVYGYCWP